MNDVCNFILIKKMRETCNKCEPCAVNVIHAQKAHVNAELYFNITKTYFTCNTGLHNLIYVMDIFITNKTQ